VGKKTNQELGVHAKGGRIRGSLDRSDDFLQSDIIDPNLSKDGRKLLQEIQTSDPGFHSAFSNVLEKGKEDRDLNGKVMIETRGRGELKEKTEEIIFEDLFVACEERGEDGKDEGGAERTERILFEEQNFLVEISEHLD